MLLLPAAFNLVYWLGLEHVTNAWQALFAAWLHELGLTAAITTERIALMDWLVVKLPLVTADARSVTTSVWFGTFFVSLAGLLVSFLIPKHLVPLRYLLRFAVFIQASSLIFFALAPGTFHHTLSSHVRDGMLLTLLFGALVPWLHSLTYYIFDFSLFQKFALTLLTIVYLLLLAPFQYLVHVWLLHHLSYLAMPILFLLFGVLMQILAFVALYGWGMSWQRPAPAKALESSQLVKALEQNYAHVARREYPPKNYTESHPGLGS